VHTVVINPEIITTNKADRDHARGGSVVLNREILRHRHFVFHAGYSGVAYGFKGARQHVFLGFFNPGFYQRHLLTTRVHGNLRGPLAYDFSAAFGLQQVNRHQALQRATILSPALTFRASRTVSLTLGYTHYNAAQSLGVVSGNAVKLSSDFKF